MGSLWRRTLALTVWLGAGLAIPAIPAAAAPAPVRLAAPADGGILRAGSLAELTWEPLVPFSRLAHAEEWEAFLSLDGGSHYTVRITPHLDRDLRTVLWQVPVTPTNDARLLLRFGDESLESAYEAPLRFSIALSPEPAFEGAPVRLALGRGEPALPGQAGVVAWAEGTRRGGGARRVEAAEPPSAQGRPSMAEEGREAGVFESPPPLRFDPAAEAGPARQIPAADRRPGVLSPLERTSTVAPFSILLQSRRRNE